MQRSGDWPECGSLSSNPVWPLTHGVILGKPLSLPGPEFSHYKMKHQSKFFPVLSLGFLLLSVCTGSLLWYLGCLQLPRSKAHGLNGCRAPASPVVVPGLSCPVARGKLASRLGIKPMSLAGEGGFSTTGPLGKSLLLSSLQLGSLSTFISILMYKKYELSSEINLSKMKVL